MAIDSINVLTLQPFYGGSHRAFIDGWIEHSRHRWSALTLPDRHWKWRMRHASIWMAEQTVRLLSEGLSFDAIVCTDMMNVAEYQGLVNSFLSGRGTNDVIPPTILYFHENQFAYPSRFPQDSKEAQRDQHFSFTNFVSALAADRCWFNSRFNLESMVEGLKTQSRHWPDFVPRESIQCIATKSEVQSPGVSLPNAYNVPLCQTDVSDDAQPIHLIWAARWEHDKGPDLLFETLNRLADRSIPFNISVLGQSFRKIPPAFEKIRDRFGPQIIEWGFAKDRTEYFQKLSQGDVFLSTANHEFFGIAAAEAISAGLYPILPNRLAYPELIEQLVQDADENGLHHERDEMIQRHTYESHDSLTLEASSLVAKIESLVRVRDQVFQERDRIVSPECVSRPWLVPEANRRRFADKFAWKARSKAMDDRLVSYVRQLN